MVPHVADPRTPTHAPRHRRALGTILLAGGSVAILDGTDAIVFNGFRGIAAGRIFQYIASALLGKASFSQGTSAVVLGVVLHCAVAVTLAGIYYGLAVQFPNARRRWLASGVAYGVVTYVAMNYAVLPLTKVARPAGLPAWPVLLNGVLAHVCCVGVPMAWWVARRLPGPAHDRT